MAQSEPDVHSLPQFVADSEDGMPRQNRWEKLKRGFQGRDHSIGFPLKRIEQDSESSQSEIVCFSTPILALQPKEAEYYIGNNVGIPPTAPSFRAIVEDDPWVDNGELPQTPVNPPVSSSTVTHECSPSNTHLPNRTMHGKLMKKGAIHMLRPRSHYSKGGTVFSMKLLFGEPSMKVTILGQRTEAQTSKDSCRYSQ